MADILWTKDVSWKKIFCILIKISPECVLRGLFDNKSLLVIIIGSDLSLAR